MSKRKRAYDISTGFTKSKETVSDPIEREIIAEDRELARDARRLRLDLTIQRRKNDLEELKRKQVTKKEITKTGSNVLQGIMDMAKVDPARAKEFLDSLSKEDIMKLNMFASSGSTGSLQALLPLMKNEGTKITDIVAIVKMMQPPPNKPTTISEVATLMKALKEDKPPQQTNIYDKFVKPMIDETRALREQMSKDRMMNFEKELAELKSKPTFVQELAGKKSEMEAFKDMFGGGTEPNLEITKMKLDQDRWKIEQNLNYGFL